MKCGFLDINLHDTSVKVAYQRRHGGGAPLVSLHGFGSTKEEYADLALRADFAGRDLIAFDAPGCGLSEIENPETLSIPFLVDVALAACDALGVDRFHLTGHSMGGLTGLLLAHANPDRVLSFFDIEGNVAPEDCFLSRQIIDYPADTPDDFMEQFQARARTRPEFGSAFYAAALPHKVCATTFKPIFTSMVEISDNALLLNMVKELSCPKAFVYGVQNRHLSYLSLLPELGVRVIEIDNSGHFPMYSNPTALWDALSGFLKEAEQLP